jgi:uncharacterized glyoxalase superfamily protein PhnB
MSFVGIRWIEVGPKDSQSTISLMLPNVQMMSNEGVVEATKKGIGTETGIWFYSDDMQSTYEELKNKGVDITPPEKQEWGGIMSKLKDQGVDISLHRMYRKIECIEIHNFQT